MFTSEITYFLECQNLSTKLKKMINLKKGLCILFLLTLLILFYYILFTPYFYNTKLEFLPFNEFSRSFNVSHLFDLNFNYVINNRCKNDSIKAVLMVTSYAGQVEGRSALRRAYPQEELTSLGVYRVFLLGLLKPHASEVTQNAIFNENDRFSDIVQGNFYEAYRNLTYKHLMGIAWAATECRAQYLLKQDDDIIVDMYTLMELIDSKRNVSYDLLGNVFYSPSVKVIRNPRNKWFVTREEFSGNFYPVYVSGWLYVLKFNIAIKLLYALQNEKFFWIDDVFVTGVLALKAHLKFEAMNTYYVTNWRYFECCIRDKVECGFIVGPNGGDFNLAVEFQKHAKMCHEGNCTKYVDGKTVKDSCVVAQKPPQLGNGTAELDVVNL